MWFLNIYLGQLSPVGQLLYTVIQPGQVSASFCITMIESLKMQKEEEKKNSFPDRLNFLIAGLFSTALGHLKQTGC